MMLMSLLLGVELLRHNVFSMKNNIVALFILSAFLWFMLVGGLLLFQYANAQSRITFPYDFPRATCPEDLADFFCVQRNDSLTGLVEGHSQLSVIEFTLFWDNDEFDVVVDGLHADATISLRLEIGSQGYDLEADDFVRAIRGGDDGFSTTLPSRPTRADNFRVVEFRIDTPPPSPVIPPTTDEVWETVSFSYEQETGQFCSFSR